MTKNFPWVRICPNSEDQSVIYIYIYTCPSDYVQPSKVWLVYKEERYTKCGTHLPKTQIQMTGLNKPIWWSIWGNLFQTSQQIFIPSQSLHLLTQGSGFSTGLSACISHGPSLCFSKTRECILVDLGLLVCLQWRAGYDNFLQDWHKSKYVYIYMV